MPKESYEFAMSFVPVSTERHLSDQRTHGMNQHTPEATRPERTPSRATSICGGVRGNNETYICRTRAFRIVSRDRFPHTVENAT